MVTKDLFNKIRKRIADTPEKRQVIIQKRMSELNQRLHKQLATQKMTTEILNKRCNL